MGRFHSEDLSYSDRLRRLAKMCERQSVSCRRLMISFGRRGQALAVVALSLPFLLPIPIPGLSILCGTLICALGFGIAIDRHMKLPGWIAAKQFPGRLMAKPLMLASKLLQWVEPFMRTRLEFVFSSRFVHACIGVTIIVGGLVVLLPLPPGTNFLSSLVCVIIGLGLLARDGLVIVGGLVLFFSKIAVYIKLFIYFADQLSVYLY